MFQIISSILALTVLVQGNSFISDTYAQSGDFSPFALGSRPYWRFSRALDHDTCWPSACVVDGKVVEPATLETYPVMGQGGCPAANSSFPTYWNAVNCSDSEIRVGHNLFYKKDGFVPINITGHSYDWEQIVVVFNKHGDVWNRTGAYLSGHGGYTYYAWDDLTTSDASNITDVGSGFDHPTIYSAWAKHSNFAAPNTELLSVLDEATPIAFRNAAYSYFNSEDEMAYVQPGSDLWNIIAAADFGEANSTPVYMYTEYCSIVNDPAL